MMIKNNELTLSNFSTLIDTYIKQHQTSYFLLAVSGGADSMVLANLLLQSGIKFDLAHVNYGLRGAASIADEQLVVDFANKNNLKLHTYNASDDFAENKTHIQEKARNIRYNFFQKIITANKGSKKGILFTAHNLNDNAETITFNFFRGSGLKGLMGIGEPSFNIARPLLTFTKQAIENYAQQNGIKFRVDSSNLENNYTRNFLRNTILPLVESRIPQAQQNIIEQASIIKHAYVLAENQAEKVLKKLLHIENGIEKINVNSLSKQIGFKYIYHKWLQSHGLPSTQWQEALKLLHSTTGKYINFNNNQLLFNRNWLWLIKQYTGNDASTIIVNEIPENTISFPLGKLSIIQKQDAEVNYVNINQNTVFIDTQLLAFPLLIRQAKTGDYFYPLGVGGKQKISKYAINQKLALPEKQNLWVVENNDKKIIWLVNHRLDERFKITPKTKDALQITLLPKT